MIKSPYLVHGTRMSLTWQVLLIAFLGVQELQTSRIDIDLINFLIQTQIAKGKQPFLKSKEEFTESIACCVVHTPVGRKKGPDEPPLPSLFCCFQGEQMRQSHSRHSFFCCFPYTRLSVSCWFMTFLVTKILPLRHKEPL